MVSPLNRASLSWPPLGHAEEFGHGPRRREAEEPLDRARAEDEHAVRGLAAHDLLPRVGYYVELFPGQVHGEDRGRGVADG